MNNFLTVLGFHMKESFRSKTFKVLSTIMLLLVIGFFGMTHYLGKENPDNILILDKTQHQLFDTSLFNERNDMIQSSAITESQLPLHLDELKKGKSDGIMVIEDTNSGAPRITYHVKQFPNNKLQGTVKDFIQMQYTALLIDNAKIDKTSADLLLSDVTFSVNAVNDSKSIGIIYLFSFIMYMFIILFGQMVAMGISSEKVSRVMEIMITKVNPLSMMYAKVISSLATGIVQILIMAIGFWIAKSMNWVSDSLSLFGLPIDVSLFDAKLIAFFAIYFILGFTLYAILFAALSSMINRIEDLNSVTAPIMVLLIFAFYIGMYSMSDPHATIVVASSYIPFFSPIITFSRLVLGEATGLEIGLSILILIMTIVILGALATKVYRSGVHRYAEKTKLSDVMSVFKKK